MLASYLEWHVRRALAPLLFDDEHKAAGEALRASVVAPAQRSPRAQAKVRTKLTAEGAPVHSFRTLLRHLAALTKNRVQPKATGATPFDMFASPGAEQDRAFKLLQVSPGLQ